MKKLVGPLMLLATAIGFLSCGKENYNPTEEALGDYFNLAPGRRITYQLDSLVKTGTDDTTLVWRSYQARDLVDAEILDGEGRSSWRIFRSLRPLESTNEADWRPSDTYVITPTREVVEVVENNLRFVKLVAPIREGNQWKGNRYINAVPGEFLEYLYDWTYTYQDIGQEFSVFDQVIPATISVLQSDENLNAQELTTVNPGQDAYRNYSKEVYAKGIGLVYRDQVYWDYQNPATSGSGYPKGRKEGGGVRLRVLSWE